MILDSQKIPGKQKTEVDFTPVNIVKNGFCSTFLTM